MKQLKVSAVFINWINKIQKLKKYFWKILDLFMKIMKIIINH